MRWNTARTSIVRFAMPGYRSYPARAEVAWRPRADASRASRRGLADSCLWAKQLGPTMGQADKLGCHASPYLRRHPGNQASTATGIRTRVSAMRGRRPSPLDDSGARSTGTRLAKRSGQVPPGLSASEAFIAAPHPGLPAPFGCAIFACSSARGCGGIGRRARFRSVSGKPGGGSSPLIRIL